MASNIQNKISVKPFNKENLLCFYSPLLGSISYGVLSVNVLNPSLALSWLPKRDLTNILLLNTLVGTGTYIYTRPHLKAIDSSARTGYSVFGSILFSFGSVLLWAVLRSVLPENVFVCGAAGVGSSYILLNGGRSYLKLVDSEVDKEKPPKK